MSNSQSYIKADSSTEDTNHSIQRILGQERRAKDEHKFHGPINLHGFPPSIHVQQPGNHDTLWTVRSCNVPQNHSIKRSYFDRSSDSDDETSEDSDEKKQSVRHFDDSNSLPEYYHNYKTNDIAMRMKRLFQSECEIRYEPSIFHNDGYVDSFSLSSHIPALSRFDVANQRDGCSALPFPTSRKSKDVTGSRIYISDEATSADANGSSSNKSQNEIHHKFIENSSKPQTYLVSSSQIHGVSKDENLMKKRKLLLASNEERGTIVNTALDNAFMTSSRKKLSSSRVAMPNDSPLSSYAFAGNDYLNRLACDTRNDDMSFTATTSSASHTASTIDNNGSASGEPNSHISSSITGFPCTDKSNKFRVRESDVDNLSLTKSGVTLTLLNSSLWMAFNRAGTEMIINRSGRRMFPYLSMSVQGLEPNTHYTVSIQITPASTRRCKFINSKWVSVGLADTEPAKPPYFHLDSPSIGCHWNRTKINFSKIKLSNNKESSPQNILLHSMHKYSIITTFTRVEYGTPSDATSSDSQSLSFHFPETDFIAVTAYQNESVTQMKIHNNPFAKAFRDSSFTEIRKRIASRKRKHNMPGRMRLASTRMETARPAPASYVDDFVYRLVTPVPIPGSIDASLAWRQYQSAGCIVPQCPSVGGLCMPWGAALPTVFPGESMYHQPGFVNIGRTPGSIISTIDTDDDSVNNHCLDGDCEHPTDSVSSTK